ncbi:hypothetical protein FHS96_005012 [Sphingomonas zeicaulis]
MTGPECAQIIAGLTYPFGDLLCGHDVVAGDADDLLLEIVERVI